MNLICRMFGHGSLMIGADLKRPDIHICPRCDHDFLAGPKDIAQPQGNHSSARKGLKG